MKDQRTSYGAKDKRSSVQQKHVIDMNCHSSGPIHLVLVGLMAGWLADEMQVEVEIFNIPYSLTIRIFTTFNISAML